MLIRFTAKTLLIAASLAVIGVSTMFAQDAATHGEEVYTAQKCQLCHSIAGKGNKTGPLDGVGSKLSAAEIRQWIVNPTEMAAKMNATRKPPMANKYSQLPAKDIDGLVAYLQTLK